MARKNREPRTKGWNAYVESDGDWERATASVEPRTREPRPIKEPEAVNVEAHPKVPLRGLAQKPTWGQPRWTW